MKQVCNVFQPQGFVGRDDKSFASGFGSLHSEDDRGRHKRLQKVLLIWASVVSFSRIYLGAHYPGDVIGGAILGSLIGVSLAKTYRYYDVNFSANRKHPSKHPHSS